LLLRRLLFVILRHFHYHRRLMFADDYLPPRARARVRAPSAATIICLPSLPPPSAHMLRACRVFRYFTRDVARCYIR